jgi:phage terminase small subunit
MQKLGLYRPEFEVVITVYAQLMDQYEILLKRFVASDYNISEATVAGSKKAPIVTTMESLRKDILAYASQLGLTPQGLLRTDDKAFAKKRRSALSQAIGESERDGRQV